MSRILRFDRIEERLGGTVEPAVVRDDFPPEARDAEEVLRRTGLDLSVVPAE